MNFDEETFLTAYLDGELTSGPRERVESSLASDPQLADDLRALAAVRDLVAGLSRPAAPCDLSASVVARIRRRPGVIAFRSNPFGRVPAGAWSWAGRTAAALATAAAVVAAVTLGLGRTAPEPLKVAQAPRPLLPLLPPGADELPSSYFVADDANLVPAVDDLAPGRDERERAEEALRLRQLLDSPNLHKVIVVTDVLGGGADRKVGEILGQTPRRSAAYGRITVTQGIVVDPEHPGRATVFAVVMDDRELDEFRGLLSRAFKDVRETEPRPGVVTQLADVGEMAVLPGTLVADLVDAPPAARDRAIRSTPGKDFAIKSRVVPGGYDADPLHDPTRYRDVAEVAPNADGPTPEQMRSGPHPSLSELTKAPDAPARNGTERRPPSPSRDDRKPAPRQNVVLVWVETPVGRGTD
jgi:hypothetical protein